MRVWWRVGPNDAITPFTFVHAAFGAGAAAVGMSAWQHFIAHLLFELLENTSLGIIMARAASIQNRKFLLQFGMVDPIFAGDTIQNAMADVLAGVVGHGAFLRFSSVPMTR